MFLSLTLQRCFFFSFAVVVVLADSSKCSTMIRSCQFSVQFSNFLLPRTLAFFTNSFLMHSNCAMCIILSTILLLTMTSMEVVVLAPSTATAIVLHCTEQINNSALARERQREWEMGTEMKSMEKRGHSVSTFHPSELNCFEFPF